MLRVIVLGTGTGAGKTRVSALLTRSLARLDPALRVGAVKPVETGFHALASQRPPRGSDAWTLERASAAPHPRPHPLHLLPEPVSPHLAARSSGIRLSLPPIARWVDTLHYDICLVETAGGALSPLSRGLVNLDLAAALAPAVWVLVAPDALGVLHDVRATWIAATSGWRAPDYLVLSAARFPDRSTGTNSLELPRVGLPRPIATLPRGCQSPAPLNDLARALLRLHRSSSQAAPRALARGAAAARRAAQRSPPGGSRRR